MNIILGEEQANSLREKYTVLELDTFRIGDSLPIKSYAVIENIPIPEMFNLESMADLHATMIEQYHQRNWSYCLDALSHLVGRWNGEIDSFYHDLESRIRGFKDQEPDNHWSWVIKRTPG